ncbi:hypothetical protein AGMMS49992_25930 [Clostridia bacterium]|nr:hypothetical protein AGMMS49992_25930 [Clostridia bacterium]
MSNRAKGQEKPYTTISTVGASRDEWLKARRHGIGGSDAAAILGLHPYKSAYSVWADKMGYGDNSDNEAMRQGRDFEEYVAKRFVEETGLKVRRSNMMYISREYPMYANIDRIVYSDGEFVGLECKTSSPFNEAKFRNEEYPDEYYTQCQHYMAVTGAKRWYLCVLVFQRKPMVYEIPRDEEDIRILIEAETRFWNDHVITGLAPAVDATDATTDAIKRMHPTANGQTIECVDENILSKLVTLKGEIQQLTFSKTFYENMIRDWFGDNEIMTGTEYMATYKNRTRADKQYRELRVTRVKEAV